MYVLTYVVLSSLGQYRPVSLEVTNVAKFELNDPWIWHPAGMNWHQQNQFGKPGIVANLPGWVFLPLLLLDRQLVHPTRQDIETTAAGLR
jgi:hypothetical protein